MRRAYLAGLALVFPAVIALTMLTTLSGCGKDKKNGEKPAATEKPPAAEKPVVSKDKEPLKAGDGILKGRVVYDGKPPARALNPNAANHKDCKDFTPEDNSAQEWLVSKDGGVANVVIFFKPPAGKYFDPAPEDKERKDVATIDQPKCAFEPRVQVLYPEYFDGKAHKPSGQKFEIKNSAGFTHDSKWEGNASVNPSGGELIPSRGKPLAPTFRYRFAGETQSTPIILRCNVHSWMNAKIWVFDHPYAARTDENGNFEIKNVPTGVEIAVFGWHEDVKGYFYGGATGEKKTFQKGENNLGDIKIKQ